MRSDSQLFTNHACQPDQACTKQSESAGLRSDDVEVAADHARAANNELEPGNHWVATRGSHHSYDSAAVSNGSAKASREQKCVGAVPDRDGSIREGATSSDNSRAHNCFAKGNRN